jgi:hypothetical protein
VPLPCPATAPRRVDGRAPSLPDGPALATTVPARAAPRIPDTPLCRRADDQCSQRRRGQKGAGHPLRERPPEALPRSECGPRPEEPLRPRQVARTGQKGAVRGPGCALARGTRLLSGPFAGQGQHFLRAGQPGPLGPVAPPRPLERTILLRLYLAHFHAAGPPAVVELYVRAPIIRDENRMAGVSTLQSRLPWGGRPRPFLLAPLGTSEEIVAAAVWLRSDANRSLQVTPWPQTAGMPPSRSRAFAVLDAASGNVP